jgi:pimeloyl-ACP methyl ester carboxylesterase
MLHDWGCLFGVSFAALHSHKVVRVIAVEVGDVSSPAFAHGLSLRGKLMIFAYQVPLALTRYIKGQLGNYLARAIATFLRCRLMKPLSIRA